MKAAIALGLEQRRGRRVGGRAGAQAVERQRPVRADQHHVAAAAAGERPGRPEREDVRQRRGQPGGDGGGLGQRRAVDDVDRDEPGRRDDAGAVARAPRR